MKRIILNQIRTPDGTILKSHSVHDYVTYIDANGCTYAVDGGCSYLRRVENGPYEELTIYSDEPFEVIRENYHRGGRGKDGKQPLTWVPISKMSDEWLRNCIVYNKDILGLFDDFANEMYQKELDYRKVHNISIAD